MIIKNESNYQLYQFKEEEKMENQLKETLVFTNYSNEPFRISYSKEESEEFESALLEGKNAEWLGGYLFNVKNVVAIKRV